MNSTLKKVVGFSWVLALGVASAAEIPIVTGGTISGQVNAMPTRFNNETVVYLKSVPGTYSPTKTAMDQLKMDFVPHVLTVTAGDTVAFTNHDSMAHNVFTPDNERYNLGTIGPGAEVDYTFKLPGHYSQLCNLHPNMLGFIFVGQNPYMVVANATGQFKIDGVPAGNYEIAVWNSHLKGADQTVSVTPEQVTKVTFSIHR